VVAANELFDEVGYDEARTGEIAKRAGFAQATLFRHFDTKADLALFHLRAVIDEVIGSVLARPAHENPYVALTQVVSQPAVIAALASDEVRMERRRSLDHPELVARIYWIVAEVREVLAVDFAARLGPNAGEVRPRVLAGVVMEAAVYAHDVAGGGHGHGPAPVFLEALAELRPLLDTESVTAGC
jgi:AcrR family transcriptional regulator